MVQDGACPFYAPALLPMKLLLTLLRPGTTLVGDGSTALLAAQWLRPDLRVSDLA